MTSQNPEFPSLPEPEQYHQAALVLDDVFRASGGIARYLPSYALAEQRRSAAMEEYMRGLSKLGAIIEPTDRSLGESLSADAPSQQAIIYGGVAGLLLARTVHGPRFPVIEAFNTLQLNSDEALAQEEDLLERKHILANSILDLGERGIASFSSGTLELLEGWESSAVPDVTKQRMFRSSLGVVTLATYQFHESMQKLFSKRAEEDAKAEIAISLANATKNPVAWDEALDGLLGRA